MNQKIGNSTSKNPLESSDNELLSFKEQVELASWEMEIRLFKELSLQSESLLNSTNENLYKFFTLFNKPYDEIIQTLTQWSNLFSNSSPNNMYCVLNNVGILDINNNLNSFFVAALEHLVAKNELMQEILDEVSYSKFDHIIDSYVSFYTNEALVNLNNYNPIGQKLGDYRFSFIIEETYQNDQ